MRISNVARSADWIAAQYLSMTGAFVTVGGEQSGPYGVLMNDFDAESDPLTVVEVQGAPGNVGIPVVTAELGTVTMNEDGTFVYTPPAAWTGTDTFTYKVNDGTADSNLATVTINVVNTAPVANDDPSVYNAAVTGMNPISYWRLGESAGPTATDSGSAGVDGTYNGGTFSQPGAITGDADTAVYFDGNDYVAIAHDPAYLVDEGAIQLWFNADEYRERGLFSKDSTNRDTGGHFEIKTNAGGQVTVRMQSTTADYLLASTTRYTPGEWRHVVVTFGAAGMELWIDGQLEDTDAYTGGLGTSSGGTGNHEPIAIGADTSGSDDLLITPITGFFRGFIDEVAIFGSQITADEITNLYGSGYAAYTTDEDTVLSVSAANGVLANDTDADFDPLNAIQVTGPSNAASFTLNADGSFSYTPNADFSGTDTFTYKANDGIDDSNVATATIFVRAINDAPINNLPAPETTTQDTALVLSTGGGNAISISDDDAGSNPVQVTLSATNGTLTLFGTAGLTFTNGDGTADGGMTFTGTVADINAALDGLTYTPNSGYVGPDLINITTTDQGNSGLGGALADSDVMSVTVTGTTAPVAVDDPDTYLLTLNELAPVAHWRLGESSGTTAVDERGIQDGTYTNGPLLDQMGAIAGDTDTAAYFNGTDNYVEINHDSAFLLDEGTIQLWFNVDAITGSSQDLISKDAGGNGTGGHFGITVTNTGTIHIRLQSVSGSFTVETAGPITAGEWHHMAFSFGSGGMALYVDGEIADTDVYTGGLGSSSGGAGNYEPIAIGAATSSSGNGRINPLNNYFAGYIDEVAILGSQLTAGQAEALFNAGVGGYEVAKGGSLTVTAADGVLANDNDPEGDPLTAILVSGPSNATAFTLNPDGSFTYTPNAAFDGYDTFTYKANDGSGDSNIATEPPRST